MEHFTPKHLAFKISEHKKKAGVFCCAYCCKNKPVYKLGGLCYKHYQIKVRMRDPVYNRYMNFKGNAAKRPWHGEIGIPFSITLQEFREFCQKTGYIIQKGKRGRNCTVDRVINTEGYHIWNIELRQHGANVRKYHNEDRFTNELPPTHEDYTPF